MLPEIQGVVGKLPTQWAVTFCSHLEQSEDSLVGDSGHVCWGVMMLVGPIYAIKTYLHDIEGLVMWYLWQTQIFGRAQKLVHQVVVIVNAILNQYIKLMFWHLVQTGPWYFALLQKIPTSLALSPEPQLALQGKFCQMWTSFLSHCIGAIGESRDHQSEEGKGKKGDIITICPFENQFFCSLYLQWISMLGSSAILLNFLFIVVRWLIVMCWSVQSSWYKNHRWSTCICVGNWLAIWDDCTLSGHIKQEYIYCQPQQPCQTCSKAIQWF